MVVKVGDTISVEYTGTLDDGTVFDKSNGNLLTFKVGSGQVIEGFDNAVVGMDLNQTKKVKIPPEQAYGNEDKALIVTVKRSQFPEDAPITPGEMVSAQASTGQQLTAKVVSAENDEVVLDFNHPLSGKSLNFEIKLVKIEE